jgi:hypothetical protein
MSQQQENPAADYVQGMVQAMKRQEPDRNKKPSFWQRLGSVFSSSGNAAPERKQTHVNPDGKLSTSAMSPAQLKIRRMERIENARVGRPFHERVMLFCLKCWMLIGPIAFVCLTAAEVAYILTRLVAPGDKNGQTIIWAGAMFIELAMMFTTFGLGIKRHEVAERRATYGTVSPADQRLVWIGTVMWAAFAAINIIGQSAFLLHLIGSTQDMTLYLFVASRVIGFILGDAGTAFFLGHVESNDVSLMARAEREKGKLYTDLAEAEGARKVMEAEAESKVQLLEIKVQQERADANFLAQLKAQTFTRLLQISDAAAPAALSSPSSASSPPPMDASFFYDDDYPPPSDPTRPSREPGVTDELSDAKKTSFKRSDRHT